ncbi:hypothetical protein [uncultured Thiohalocapsa sp.]|uniref:hypothetical protein n=1 Tax=uncultured Thiohalocapsa sp. TaxID=768990 RepID=UPI0025EA2162|nr:hypothetical protein [uncultured Thiohalocapsa sp.]
MTVGPAAELKRADEPPVAVPEPSAETLPYYRNGNVLGVLATLWGLLPPAVILFSGFSARPRDWARADGRSWFFTIAVYVLLYLALVSLIDLPLNWYQDFVRAHAYGLSSQTLGQGLADSLKALAVTMVIGVLVLWVPYLLRHFSRRWWLWTSLAAVPFLIPMLFMQPVLIGPLFDDVGSWQDKALEARLLALAERAGIDGGQVFVLGHIWVLLA